MGRPKFTLKPIPNGKKRNLEFMKRKKELMTKLSEFSTECGVSACLIIYDGNGDAPVVTWPQDHTKVYSIIEKYERAMNEKPPKIFDIHDYFKVRKNSLESKISKVRRGIKYPTWHPSFNSLREEQLRNFIAMLDTKLEACNQRINMLKNQHPIEANFSLMQNMVQSESATPNASQLNFMENISQNHLLLAPMNPPNDGNQLESQSQMVNFDPNIMQLMAKNNGMVDITHQHDVPVDCTNQMVAFGNSTNQLDVSVLMANNNGMVGITNQVDLPVDWTNQIGAFGNSTNQLDVPVDWTNQFGVPVIGMNNITSATAMNGASIYGTNFHVFEKDGSEDNLDSSLCNYNGGVQSMQPCNFDPALQNIATQSENLQQGAAVHTLPPTVDEFHIDDYDNILLDQIFNLIN